MITDAELNQIIKQPQGEICLKTRTYTPYQCYIGWQMYKSMEPKRMIAIFEKMEQAGRGLTTSELNRITKAKCELIQQQCIMENKLDLSDDKLAHFERVYFLAAIGEE